MLGWSVGWQEVLVLLGCFGGPVGVVGLVLLIVGLATKRRGLWIAGLALLGGIVLVVVLLALVLVVLASKA